MYDHTIHVTVAAESVTKDQSGNYIIELAARQVSAAEHKVLADLFPDMGQAVDRLLCMQAMLQAIR